MLIGSQCALGQFSHQNHDALRDALGATIQKDHTPTMRENLRLPVKQFVCPGVAAEPVGSTTPAVHPNLQPALWAAAAGSIQPMWPSPRR